MWSETFDFRSYRPPYLPQFFAEAARRLQLSGREALLDLGCGWGDVSFGLAPYVAAVTGVDAELPSLAAMAARGRELKCNPRLVHSRVEDVGDDLGQFDLITIGKAYWFVHTPAALERIDRWLRPGGRVLLCAPVEVDVDGPPWHRLFLLIQRRWMRDEFAGLFALTPDEFFAGTDFARVDQIDVFGEQIIELEDLVRRAFACPFTTPAMLAQNAERLSRDVRTLMARFFKNGPITERLRTTGTIFRRRRDVQS